jgi:hypothetical protein
MRNSGDIIPKKEGKRGRSSYLAGCWKRVFTDGVLAVSLDFQFVLWIFAPTLWVVLPYFDAIFFISGETSSKFDGFLLKEERAAPDFACVPGCMRRRKAWTASRFSLPPCIANSGDIIPNYGLSLANFPAGRRSEKEAGTAWILPAFSSRIPGT